MPTRRVTQQFDSKKVQGEDSYVVVSFQTVAEMRAIRKERADAEQAGNTFDNFEAGLAVLKNHVIGWNWVDDDGNPLPQIRDDPMVLNHLNDPEIAFLSKCILGSEEDAKN